MRIIFICGYYDESHFEEIRDKSADAGQQAANRWQKRLIEGLSANGNVVEVVSAPFIPSWPNGYSDISFNGFNSEDDAEFNVHYVPFNNIWGLRNISRTHAIRRYLKGLKIDEQEHILIIVYSAHTPFLTAARYLKKRMRRSKICLVVPDLPQYMNLTTKQSIMYRVFKKLDIQCFTAACRSVDSFVLLTEQMRELLPIGQKPYTIIEGICSSSTKEPADKVALDSNKHIVYTGKVDSSFGIENLLEAFSGLKNSELRLDIYGSGDAEDVIIQFADKDDRIVYHGLVSAAQATEAVERASILVNPRISNDDYTRYSFPSKTIEYLLAGKPVVSSVLQGMPSIYKTFVYEIRDSSVAALRNAIVAALNADPREVDAKARLALNYLMSERTPVSVANTIIKLNSELPNKD